MTSRRCILLEEGVRESARAGALYRPEHPGRVYAAFPAGPPGGIPGTGRDAVYQDQKSDPPLEDNPEY